MSNRSITHVIISWGVIGLLILPLGAQQSQKTSVIIERIASSAGKKPHQIFAETDSVRIYRNSQWLNATPGFALLWDDVLQMKKYLHLDIRVEGIQEGNLILLPDALQNGAAFRIEREKEDQEGRVQLEIDSGAVAIEWKMGQFSVVRNGIRSVISGSRVSFLTDPNINRKLVHLENGSLYFPDYQEVSMAAGEVAELVKGVGPKKLSLTPLETANLERVVRYNVEYPWKTFEPWYKNPLFFVPVGLAAVAGGVWLLASGGEEGGGPGGRSQLADPPSLP